MNKRILNPRFNLSDLKTHFVFLCIFRLSFWKEIPTLSPAFQSS